MSKSKRRRAPTAIRLGMEIKSISEDHPSLKMVRQPETRPISGNQLLLEVKGIYSGLMMVEAKCVEVDGKQAAQVKAMEIKGLKQSRLTNEQWQALIALHRTLLHEHHDFFLASQHPSPSSALRRLVAKYAIPARMWRHGIHSFLELLRHRLSYSIEKILKEACTSHILSWHFCTRPFLLLRTPGSSAWGILEDTVWRLKMMISGTGKFGPMSQDRGTRKLLTGDPQLGGSTTI